MAPVAMTEPAGEPAVTAVEVVTDQALGAGGFLTLRRTRLVNLRADGTRSSPYPCDFVTRDVGIDAVVVVVWRRRGDGGVDVLLRRGLRPPLALGRGQPDPAARPGEAPRWWSDEVVAGIVERGELGEAGLVARAQAEVAEEAGLTVAASAVVRLGAAVDSSPGLIAEALHLFAVEVDPSTPARAPAGDGSPMEEGATLRWHGLDQAIAAAVAGALRDCKSELALRRLRDHLAG